MAKVDISRYIVCRVDCPLRQLEALAMIGFARGFEVVDCDKKRFKKIVLKLIDGSSVESQCRFEEEVAVTVRIIASYIGLYRDKNVEERLRVVKHAKKEE